MLFRSPGIRAGGRFPGVGKARGIGPGWLPLPFLLFRARQRLGGKEAMGQVVPFQAGVKPKPIGDVAGIPGVAALVGPPAEQGVERLQPRLSHLR